MKKEDNWIQEDWEIIYKREQSYLEEERKRAEIREWQLWEHEQNRLPAKINVIMPKKKIEK